MYCCHLHPGTLPVLGTWPYYWILDILRPVISIN